MLIRKSDSSTDPSFDQAADLLMAKRPALNSVIRPFATVLAARQTLIAETRAFVPALNWNQTADNLYAGTPMIQSVSFTDLQKPLKIAFVGLLPVLKRSFPVLDKDFCTINTAIEKNVFDLGLLAHACLSDNDPLFRSMAQKGNSSVNVLGFTVNWAISTVLNAARTQWVQPAKLSFWPKGYCPVCGALPAVSSLCKSSTIAAEYLSSNGGQKYLYCAMCGHQWRFMRHQCPVCDIDNAQFLSYYQETGETSERIDVCKNCGHYLLCIDLREYDDTPQMDMASLGMVHLDILARKKGYRPMSWTPWNRIESL